MDKFHLIELVKEMPPLWDKSDMNYTNREIKPILWQEIGQKLNVPGRDAQKTWEMLRDIYRRELKRFLTNNAGKTSGFTDVRWKYFKNMSFVRNVMKPKKKSVETDSDIDEKSDAFKENIAKAKFALRQEEMDDSSHQSTTKENEASEEKPLQKKNAYHEMKKKMNPPSEDIGKLKAHMDEDDDFMFLMSLLPSIKKLGDIQKLKLRMEFLGSLSKELQELESQCSSYSTMASLNTNLGHIDTTNEDSLQNSNIANPDVLSPEIHFG